jgi:hypothetical protein
MIFNQENNQTRAKPLPTGHRETLFETSIGVNKLLNIGDMTN